jgi:hypothetical protein
MEDCKVYQLVGWNMNMSNDTLPITRVDLIEESRPLWSRHLFFNFKAAGIIIPLSTIYNTEIYGFYLGAREKFIIADHWVLKEAMFKFYYKPMTEFSLLSDFPVTALIFKKDLEIYK